MGYSIYYDRAFISVGDMYIPLVCSGASNCADYVKGRLVSEKNWDVLNWKRRDRVLFTESEIRDIAKDYESHNQESGMIFKSRKTPFAPGEFERWIVGGMKRAHTIEEYISFRNRLTVVDFPDGRAKQWGLHPFSTKEEFLNIIKQFGTGHEFDVTFHNQREVNRPTVRKPQKYGDKDRTANQEEAGRESVLDKIRQGNPTTGPEKPANKKREKDGPEH